MCWKNKGVGATLIELCDKCMHKKGTEPILAVVGAKAYAMCFECGKWTFNVHNLNVRICQSCFHRFRKHFKNLRRKGVDNVDPFYVWARKQFGKDWKLLMNDGVSFRGI